MKRLLILLLLVSFRSVLTQTNNSNEALKYSPLTENLLAFLQGISGKKVLFGHQDDLAYGIGWEYVDGNSDVKKVTGSYPAVFGWEVGRLELDSARSLDSVPFDKMRNYIKQVYDLGGINTISWHLDNPVNGLTAWDTTSGTIAKILPGGRYHKKFIGWLDHLSVFLGSLKNDEGELIPVILRPYHENSRSWFWWGKKENSDEDFKALWQFTLDYLRIQKGLHNILSAYSPANFESVSEYESRYPGDEYVDIVGFDTYAKPTQWDYTTIMGKQLALLQQVAAAHKKVAALTETGYVMIPDPNWWTGTLLPLLHKYKVSYVLVWRNARLDHFYAPYPGQASAADFKKFYNDSLLLFQDGLGSYPVYH